MGKQLTLRGGSDLDKIFRGVGFFWLFVGGDRFFDLEGGRYPLDSVTRISKIFQNFQARGGTLWIFGSNFSKRGGIFCPRVPFLRGGSRDPKFFWGGIYVRLRYACPRMHHHQEKLVNRKSKFVVQMFG